jgi:hypothetical protein
MSLFCCLGLPNYQSRSEALSVNVS